VRAKQLSVSDPKQYGKADKLGSLQALATIQTQNARAWVIMVGDDVAARLASPRTG
jgi:hypothetical protein